MTARSSRLADSG